MPELGSHPPRAADAPGASPSGSDRPAATAIPGLFPEDHLAAIVDSSDDAILSKSATGEILSWNAGAERLYGYAAEEAVGRPIGLLIPPHRKAEEQVILQRILAGQRVDHYETERIRKDGEIVNISLTVSPVRGADGEILGASVIARNITDRKQAEERAERIRSLTAALTEALSPGEVVDLALRELLPAVAADAATVALVSDDGTMLELAGSSGYSDEVLKGWQSFPVDADLPLSEAVRTKNPVWTSSPESLVERYPALAQSDVRFASLAAVPLVVEARVIGAMALSFHRVHPFIAEDKGFILSVAQQTAVALERGRLYDREQRARAEAQRAEERMAFLSRASEILAESLDLDAILQRIADVAVPRIADWCGVELLDEDGTTRQVAVGHVDPAKVELARELRRRYPPDPDAPTGLPAVVRTGEPEVYPEVTDEMIAAAAQDEEHLKILRGIGISSAMVVPLEARARTLGAVTFITSESGHRYGDADLAFAEDLARRAALAVDNSLLYSEEHHAAITLQRSLLPVALPETDGIEVAARYLPAGRGVEVGGDWYDAVELGDRLVVVVGDVAGRGIVAASVMGQLRSALRAYAFEGQPPARAVEMLNRLAAASDGTDMATLLYLLVDRSAGRLEYVRAGHPPALVRCPDGTVRRLEAAGSPPVGVLENAVYRSDSESLPDGSLVLLYTDGLIERRDKPVAGQLEKLERALGDAPDDLEACCDFVLEALGVDERAKDDTALLALRVMGTASGASFRMSTAAELRSLTEVRKDLGGWLRGVGLAWREAHAVVTAASEACANAAEHAYGPDEAGALQLEAALEQGEVVVTVQDFGRWREPGRREKRSVVERGRGLRVMEGLMERVDVVPSAHGTKVVMRRSVSGEVAA